MLTFPSSWCHTFRILHSRRRCDLQIAGDDQFVPVDVDRVGEMRTADGVVAVTVFGRFLHAHQQHVLGIDRGYGREAALVDALAFATERIAMPSVQRSERSFETVRLNSGRLEYGFALTSISTMSFNLTMLLQSGEGQSLVSDGVDHWTSPPHRDDIILGVDDPLNVPSPSLKRMAFLVCQIMHVINSDDCRCGMSQHRLGHMRRDPQF